MKKFIAAVKAALSAGSRFDPPANSTWSRQSVDAQRAVQKAALTRHDAETARAAKPVKTPGKIA